MSQDSEKRPDAASSTASKALRSIQNFPSHTAVNYDCFTYVSCSIALELLCKDGNPSTKSLQTWEFVCLNPSRRDEQICINMLLPFLLAQKKHTSEMQRLEQTDNQLLKAGTLFIEASNTFIHRVAGKIHVESTSPPCIPHHRLPP